MKIKVSRNLLNYYLMKKHLTIDETYIMIYNKDGTAQEYKKDGTMFKNGENYLDVAFLPEDIEKVTIYFFKDIYYLLSMLPKSVSHLVINNYNILYEKIPRQIKILELTCRFCGMDVSNLPEELEELKLSSNHYHDVISSIILPKTIKKFESDIPIARILN